MLNKRNINRFQRSLLEWFHAEKRTMPWRNTTDPYAIWISEVMLQQTQVATVIPYFERFLAAFPNVSSLARANPDDVLKRWEGLGYYARARNLQKAAQIVVASHNSQIPNTPDAFLSLPGVGPYINAAVQSIAFGRPLAALDGNVKRVLARVLTIDKPVNTAGSHKAFQLHADKFLNEDAPGDHNEAMMELGARICTPQTPRCDSCPVAAICMALKNGEVNQFPIKQQKKKIPTHAISVAVIRKRDKVLICKRKDDGLLGGLWEFPGGKIDAQETAEDACMREVHEEVGLGIRINRQLTTVKHAYSHFKIEMDVFLCDYEFGRVRLNGPVDFAWVKPSALKNYAFPGANNKFIPLLLETISS